MTDDIAKDSKDVTKCKIDNDCYAVPGWPTADEKTKTCCVRREVIKYDKTGTDFTTTLTTMRNSHTGYAYDDEGTITRYCTSDYPTKMGSTKYDQTTYLTVDADFKKSGVQYKAYCDGAASLAISTMAAIGAVYQFV